MSLGYDDQEMRENMEAFEAAAQSKHVDLKPPSLRSILVALDGSNQDTMVTGLALTLARRTGASLLVLYAYEGAPHSERDAYLEEQVRQLAGQEVIAQTWARTDRRSFEQILEAAQQGGSDLIVVCAPYLDDFATLGRASTGTNLDMLLAGSRVPVLVAREPDHDPARCLGNILLPLSASRACDVEAARWALLLTPSHGDLRLLVVVDTALLENARHLMEAFVHVDQVDETALAGLDRPETAGLIGALQKAAWERSFGCHVTVRVGDTVPVVAELANEGDHVVIAPCPGRQGQGAFQRVQTLIRESGNPVMIV